MYASRIDSVLRLGLCLWFLPSLLVPALAGTTLTIHNDAATSFSFVGYCSCASPHIAWTGATLSPGATVTLNSGNSHIVSHDTQEMRLIVAASPSGTPSYTICDGTTWASQPSDIYWNGTAFTGGSGPFYYKKCWTNARTDGQCINFLLYHPSSGYRSGGQTVCPGETKCITVGPTTNKVGWVVMMAAVDARIVYEADTNGVWIATWDPSDDKYVETISSSDAAWSSVNPPSSSGSGSNTGPGTTGPSLPTSTNIVFGAATGDNVNKLGFEGVTEAIRQQTRQDGVFHEDERLWQSQLRSTLTNELGKLGTIMSTNGSGSSVGVTNAINANTLSTSNLLGNATNYLANLTNLFGMSLTNRDGRGTTITNWDGMTNSAVAAGNAAETALSSALAIGVNTNASSTGIHPDWTWTVGGYVWDFDPSHYAEISTLAQWIRGLIAWCCVLGLTYYVVHRTADAVHAMGGFHQSQGSMVSVAGFGTNFPTAAGASLIMVAAMVLVGSYVLAWKTNNAQFLGLLLVDPLSTAYTPIANGVWLANLFLPLNTMMVEAGAGLTFTIGLTAMMYGKSILVRSLPG